MRVLHVIDSATSRDGLLQLPHVVGLGDTIASAGPPPRNADLALPVRRVHVPLGIPALCGRRMRTMARSTDAVCAWGSSAFEAALTAADGRCVLTVLPAAQPQASRRKLARAVRDGRTQLVVPTDPSRQALLDAGANEGSVHVMLPPAVDPPDRAARRAEVRDALGFDDEIFVLVVLGEMNTRSGHKQAVWGAAIAGRYLPRIRLILPGTGMRTQQVGHFVASTGFDAEFLLTGERWPLADVLCAADAAAHVPSRDTGVAALAAAMAAGLAPIITPTPDALACVEDPDAAICVPIGKPSRTAAAIARLAEEPGVISALGERARENSRLRFAPSAAARRLATLHAAAGSTGDRLL